MFYSDEEINEAWKRSEISSCPLNDVSKDFVVLHTCEICKKKYFCPSINERRDSRCECKNHVCHLCYNFQKEFR